MTRDIQAWPEQATGNEQLGETKEKAIALARQIQEQLGPYGCYFEVADDGCAWRPPPWLLVMNDRAGNVRVTVDPDVLVREWNQLQEGFQIAMRRLAELEGEIVALQARRNGVGLEP